MLLEEDPATLVRHTINNFNIVPDKNAVARVNESLSTLQQARDLRLRDAENALKKLSRTLNTMQSQHSELTSTHSSAAHASDIARLDTQKFRIAKAASDLEVETERLQAQADELAARLQELELQGADGLALGSSAAAAAGGALGAAAAAAGAAAGGRDPVEDEILLRLKVYRGLGIDIERDGEDGEFNRAVVRNDRKGDVHVVNIDRKFSRFFYANYFWQTL